MRQNQSGAPSWRRRWVPHPRLSLVMVVAWLLLQNAFSVGALLLGVILGLAIPRLTAGFWPDRPRLGPWHKIAAYALLVMRDIVTANIHVARLILFRPADRLRPGFIAIPLELRSPEAVAALAGTITMTPGTVSCDLSADGRSLLVHCLDLADPEAEVRAIKARYESRLLEIFP